MHCSSIILSRLLLDIWLKQFWNLKIIWYCHHYLTCHCHPHLPCFLWCFCIPIILSLCRLITVFPVKPWTPEKIYGMFIVLRPIRWDMKPQKITTKTWHWLVVTWSKTMSCCFFFYKDFPTTCTRLRTSALDNLYMIVSKAMMELSMKVNLTSSSLQKRTKFQL